MKFVSWNVNGLRACAKKGFEENFLLWDADIVCLQETKMQEGQLDLPFVGYQSYWNYADKKGYSGTAIYTRHTPLSVSRGIGIDLHDHEGRIITMETDDFYLVCCYTPNSQDNLRRLDYRQQWENDFYLYARRLDEHKPVIVCGDLNVAHEEIDLKNPKTNRLNAGFSDEERRCMSRWLGEGFQVDDTPLPRGGFTDTFRHLHPNEEKYSWWSYRMKARERNVGWRIDYFLVSTRLVPRVTSATILDTVYGSDHCPVSLTID